MLHERGSSLRHSLIIRLGEIMADLEAEGATRHDIGFLRLARFDEAAVGVRVEGDL